MYSKVVPGRVNQRLGQCLLGHIRVGADRGELGQDRLAQAGRLGQQVTDGDGPVGGIAPARSGGQVLPDGIVQGQLVVIQRDAGRGWR